MFKRVEEYTCRKWCMSVVTIMLMLVLFISLTGRVFAQEVKSGTMGDKQGIKWSYAEATKTLTLTGEDSGLRGRYDGRSQINNFCSEVEHIVLKDCTLIGDTTYMFAYLMSLKTFTCENVNTTGVTSMRSLFDGCSNLVSVNVKEFDTSNVTSLAVMFYMCNNLKEVDLSGFHTGAVTDMSMMFYYCSNLEQVNLSCFDTTKVINMQNMFSGCGKLAKIYAPKVMASSQSVELPNTFYDSRQNGTNVMTSAFCNDVLTREMRAINPFADISDSSWQFYSAKYVYDKGLMAGKGTDGNGKVIFDPNKTIPREEFVQVLYNASGKPAVSGENPFSDVKDAWYKTAILWANANDIAKGKGNGSFGVAESISRQDMALMLYKYARMRGYDLSASGGEINKYADGNKVAGYAKTAMDWAITKGIMSGKGKKGEDISTYRLDPAGTATRGECAAMLKNFMEAYGL